MSSVAYDVVVIGAGVAGLTAVRLLCGAGLNVLCLEARARIGGRIHTVRDPLVSGAVELGAEFVHGRPPAILEIASNAGLTVVESAGHRLRVEQGRPLDASDGSEALDAALSAAACVHDEPFETFLRRQPLSEQQKRWARDYVEGFNAARADRIGIAALAMEAQAADAIDGDRLLRLPSGYDSIPLALYRSIPQAAEKVRLSSIVERVEWSAGEAAVHIRSALDDSPQTVRSRAVVVTVPLGVLQAGAIRFDPEPDSALDAANKLCFGRAVRVTLQFDRPGWRQHPELSHADILLSDEPLFPTWWTAPHGNGAIVVGWSAGPKADALAGRPVREVLECAQDSLRRITGGLPGRMTNAWHHDWQSDPFALGVYSYVPAGGLAVRQQFTEPVAGTLFFAGEATDTTGHTGTVHGAIATGERAAAQVRSALVG